MGRIMVVFGTRPEAIKLLPVIASLRALGVPTRTCTTGQHRELLDQVLAPECLVPDFDLKLMEPGQSLPTMTGRLIVALGDFFATQRPDRVVVQGDTATAFAAAHAAYLSGIPVAHVEAGLRTGNLAHPHPEEGYRRMISTVADLHLAPTRQAAANLMREGVPTEFIHVTGNPVIDASQTVRSRLQKAGEIPAEIASILHQSRGKHLVLVTCHRRENRSRLDGVLAAVRQLAARDDVMIAFPVHPSPGVHARAYGALAGVPAIELLPPLDFLPFIALLSAAHFVLTDSGGVQEEAPILGVPVLVLRETTERPEGVEAGTSLLVGTDPDRIVREATRLLDNPLTHARMARRHSPYGDGRAGERIAGILASALGYGVRVATASTQ